MKEDALREQVDNYAAFFHCDENGAPKLLTTNLGEHDLDDAEELAFELASELPLEIDKVEVQKVQ